MTSKSGNQRIQAIDGWRSIAALGVLWTHTWAITRFQSLMAGKINIFKAINIIGNGVHLFFVISGFCMYLILHKQKHYTFQVFISFVKKRWIRIAPAFYNACIIISFWYYFNRGQSPFPRLIYNFLFLQNHLPDSIINSPFWSLAVEWHFYLILPLLFIINNRIGFLKGALIFGTLSLLCNVLHYNNILLANAGWWYFLPGNLIHFVWGILLAYVIVNNITLPRWLSKNFSVILAIALANFGKSLFSDYGLQFAKSYAWINHSIGPAIMSLGFCWLIYISLKNDFIGNIIGNKYFAKFGKISYSFYLWHAFILEFVYEFAKNYLNFSGFNAIVLFVLTLIVLLPVSYLSYFIFEKFYFKEKKLQPAL